MAQAKRNTGKRKKNARLTVDAMVDVLRYLVRGYSQPQTAKLVNCSSGTIAHFLYAVRAITNSYPADIVAPPQYKFSDQHFQKVSQAVENYRAAYGTLELPPLDVKQHDYAIAGNNAKKVKQALERKAEENEAESVSELEQLTFVEAEPDTADSKGWLTTSTLISVEAHGVYADVAGSEQALTVTVGTVQFQMSAAQLKAFASELLEVVEALRVSE